jgi:pyroglutamyl-peptidase
MRILLTGFEPFGGEAVNASLEAVRALAGWQPEGVALGIAVLPVSAARLGAAVRAAIAEHRADAVLLAGQAASRAEMSVERVAINVIDARIPDNDGAQPIDVPVVAGGPAAYLASAPIKAIAAALRAGGIPASVSNTAGTFLCNAALYLACHLAATEFAGVRAGFIHVPRLPEQAARHPGAPSMALPTLIAGLRIAVETLRDMPGGLAAGEGRID